MYYFIVIAYNHLSIDKKMQFNEHLYDKVKKFDTYHIVREYGANGANPHMNVVIKCSESKGRSFREILKNWFKKIDAYDEQRTLCAKQVLNDINLANVMCGYLEKEEQHEVVMTKGFDIEKIRKFRQNKPVSMEARYELININSFHDMCINYYMQKYQEHTRFDKQCFKQIVAEINKFKNISSVVGKLKSIYISLEGKLSNSNEILFQQIDRDLGN